jgi:CRISPR-associated protein Csx10
MRHLYLLLTARSPLAIRADHAEGGAATAKYIPGATLRGSLAAAHRILRPGQDEDEEFTRFFLTEEVFFPHLYPASFAPSHMGLAEANLPVKPLPKTARSCKRFPGFRPLKGEESYYEERHGIRDSLLDWAVFSLLDREKRPVSAVLAPLEQHQSCTSCQQALDHVEGYYRGARGDPRQRMRARSNTRLQTRTGINRDWGVVEESILYNREVFDDGMQFWGELLFPDEEPLPEEERLVSRFKNFLEETKLGETRRGVIEKPGVLRLGTGRTRGLGCVDAKVLDIQREEKAHFRQRLERFNTALQTRAGNLGVQKLATFYFALTLSSATILCDPFLRYQRTLDTATLGHLLEYPAEVFTPVYQAAGIQRLTGWSDLWGTPRASDYALEMGSTFLFASSRSLEDDDGRLLDALYALEEAGLGRRCAEGFGRVCVSDPFHLEGEQL